MKKTFTFTLCLLTVFLSLISPAFADTAFLNLDSNVYYEDTAVMSTNLEDIENASHLFDFSLNDNHQLINGSMTVQTGFFGDCYYFDGVTKESLEGQDLNIENQDFTIMMWVKRDGTMANKDIIGHRISAGDSFYIGGTNATHLRVRRGGSQITSNISLPDGTWAHITVSYVHSGTSLYLYQNWTCVAEGSLNSFLREDYAIGAKREIADDSAWISGYWKGNIDEVRIFQNLAIIDPSTIQTWALREIQTPLTIQDLEANTDIVQLWFENETLFEQQTADSNGEAVFNVFSFSEKNGTFNGVLNIYHEDIQYEGYVMVLNWGDIYRWVVLGVFADLFTQLFFGTGAWLGLIIVVSSALLLSNFVRYGSLVFYPILFFFGLGYLTNVSADSNLLYATVICWMTIPLLLFIETKQK